MTRKDYETFAGLLYIAKSNFREPNGEPDSTIVWLERQIADIFTADNPRFDRERFYRACEPQGESEEAK